MVVEIGSWCWQLVMVMATEEVIPVCSARCSRRMLSISLEAEMLGGRGEYIKTRGTL